MKTNLITTALLLSTSAFVQAETKTELEPINVYSAYATPVNQDQTASSVTVLTEKDFAERNATYVSDVLKTVPGVAMGATGGRGAVTSLFLRGAESNHTVVVIDGVKMNPVNDGFDFGGLTLSNIERIEVLRGEQSALWGSDAIGGVVYITTKSGLYKEKPLNIDFDLGLGSHRTRDASATISGYQGGFYYALHGDSHRTAGISVLSKDKFNYKALDGTSIPTGGAIERDGFHRDNGSLRLGYDDNNNKGVEVLASHSSQTTKNDTSLLSEAKDKDFFRARESTLKLSGYAGNDQDLFKHKASVSHIKNDYDYVGTSPYTRDWKKLNVNYQLDINFDREGYLKQGVSVLGEYQKSHYEALYTSSIFKEQKLTEKSIATEYRLFTEDDHSLSLSGRFTDSDNFKNTFTSRIAGAYRLSENVKAHASFGTAVHNPNFVELYGYGTSTSSYFPAITWVGNPDLKPEKSRGGEVGFLLETTNKNHSLDVTYFARIVNNFIGSEPVATNVTRAINVKGKTNVRGVEVAYKGKITDALSGYVNYTYTQIKNGESRLGAEGDTLIRRPKNTVNAGLAYQITEKLGSDINVSYVSKRFDTYFQSVYPYAQKRVKMPSYTLVNLGVNYQLIPNLNIYANLNNLFNKKYENVLGYGQDGRNVYVGLKGSF